MHLHVSVAFSDHLRGVHIELGQHPNSHWRLIEEKKRQIIYKLNSKLDEYS
jgi:hypothetical protein